MATYVANVQTDLLQLGDLVLGFGTRHAGPIVRFEPYPNCPLDGDGHRRAVFADGTKITLEAGGGITLPDHTRPLMATLDTPPSDGELNEESWAVIAEAVDRRNASIRDRTVTVEDAA